MNFDNRAHEIVRSWYIDGRIFYHKVVDLDNPKQGITELRYVDAMKMRRLRQKLGKMGTIWIPIFQEQLKVVL